LNIKYNFIIQKLSLSESELLRAGVPSKMIKKSGYCGSYVFLRLKSVRSYEIAHNLLIEHKGWRKNSFICITVTGGNFTRNALIESVHIRLMAKFKLPVEISWI